MFYQKPLFFFQLGIKNQIRCDRDWKRKSEDRFFTSEYKGKVNRHIPHWSRLLLCKRVRMRREPAHRRAVCGITRTNTSKRVDARVSRQKFTAGQLRFALLTIQHCDDLDLHAFWYFFLPFVLRTAQVQWLCRNWAEKESREKTGQEETPPLTQNYIHKDVSAISPLCHEL